MSVAYFLLLHSIGSDELWKVVIDDDCQRMTMIDDLDVDRILIIMGIRIA